MPDHPIWPGKGQPQHAAPVPGEGATAVLDSPNPMFTPALAARGTDVGPPPVSIRRVPDGFTLLVPISTDDPAEAFIQAAAMVAALAALRPEVIQQHARIASTAELSSVPGIVGVARRILCSSLNEPGTEYCVNWAGHGPHHAPADPTKPGWYAEMGAGA